MSVRARIERLLVDLPGLERRHSRWEHEDAYYVGEREIAHFHGDGRMDVRLTKERIRELKATDGLDPRVRTRGPSANWATVPLASERDAALALALVEDAIRANA
jgi:hypothetical protein